MAKAELRELKHGAAQYAVISLNRPEVRNAFDAEMIDELTRLFLEVGPRADLFALVLEGAGESFCTGADLAYMRSMAAFNLDENQKDAEKLFDMFMSLYDVPVPVLAKVHGHAMGGALGLIAACDFVAIEASTQMSFSEVRLGLVPAVISPFVYEKCEPGFSYRNMLTGRLFSGNEAVTAGLAQHTGSESEVQQFIGQTLKELVSAGPEAVRETKRLLRSLRNHEGMLSLKHQTTQVIAERRVSLEGQEGLRAFFEKRKPVWLK